MVRSVTATEGRATLESMATETLPVQGLGLSAGASREACAHCCPDVPDESEWGHWKAWTTRGKTSATLGTSANASWGPHSQGTASAAGCSKPWEQLGKRPLALNPISLDALEVSDSQAGFTYPALSRMGIAVHGGALAIAISPEAPCPGFSAASVLRAWEYQVPVILALR